MRHDYRLLLLGLCCVLVGLAIPARAHDPSLSGIRILYRQNDVVVNVMTHISRLLQAEGNGKTTLTPLELDVAIRRRLHLWFDGKELNAKNSNVIGDNTADLLSWQVIVADPVKVCEVLARLYPEDPNSRTVVTFIRDGQVFQEVLLDAAHPDLLKSQPPLSLVGVALRYVREGIEHIFGGADHILFVLGLLLLGGSLKALFRTVTAFTLAHSVTLTLAATGILSPSPRVIEPLIALSIVAIAIENLRTLQSKRADETTALSAKERDLRPYYAFGFGLIHGFGFAGALAEVGLPKAALGIALASFNLGVEMGQVTLILLVMPGLIWLSKSRPILFRPVVFTGSLLIGMAGATWFFLRLNPI